MERRAFIQSASLLPLVGQFIRPQGCSAAQIPSVKTNKSPEELLEILREIEIESRSWNGMTEKEILLKYVALKEFNHANALIGLINSNNNSLGTLLHALLAVAVMSKFGLDPDELYLSIYYNTRILPDDGFAGFTVRRCRRFELLKIPKDEDFEELGELYEEDYDLQVIHYTGETMFCRSVVVLDV